MSILIRGMEMPKNCKSCRFCGFGGRTGELNVCMFTGESQPTLSVERMSKCPLIELQPHGRLIDADKIEYVQSENGCLDDYAYRYDISEMPTIIPVEEGE